MAKQLSINTFLTARNRPQPILLPSIEAESSDVARELIQTGNAAVTKISTKFDNSNKVFR